jgi:predicted DNA-binding transcriptional regulator YafY
MLYERSFTIEQRLRSVLEMVRAGRFSTPTIAEQLGVSVPTVSRDVTALRERGHPIRAKRCGSGWRYVLAPDDSDAARRSQRESRKTVTL